MSELFGFGGRRGSGKTTAAAMLKETVEPRTYKHIEFSDSITQIAELWFHRLSEQPDASPETHKEWLIDLLSDFAESIQRDANIPVISDNKIENLFNDTRPNISQNKEHYRELLEWLGSSAIRLATPEVWGSLVRKKVRDAELGNTDLITVSGVRSVADANIVHSQNGALIKLHRALAVPQAASEIELSNWTADYDITNNGGLDDLRQEIITIWERNSTKKAPLSSNAA